MSRLLVAAACLLALACGPEPSTVSTLREAPTTMTVAALPPAPAPREAPPSSKESPPGDPCIEVDSDHGGKRITLEGELFIDDAHEHPTRGKTRPYILRLDIPRCATGIEEAHVTELHLASTEGVELKPLVGRRVRVWGDPFAAFTAWHARPVVLMTTKVTRLP